MNFGPVELSDALGDYALRSERGNSNAFSSNNSGSATSNRTLVGLGLGAGALIALIAFQTSIPTEEEKVSKVLSAAVPTPQP